MVMGPTAGAILAGLGADVTKVEPMGGDKTRKLKGRAPATSQCSIATSGPCKSILRTTKGLGIAKQ